MTTDAPAKNARDRILEAACAAIAEDGIDDVRIARVAMRAGASTALVLDEIARGAAPIPLLLPVTRAVLPVRSMKPLLVFSCASAITRRRAPSHACWG